MKQIDLANIAIQVVEAARVRPLRQRVLRPHQRLEEMVYPGDDADETFHLAGLDAAGQVLGIASYYADAHPHGGRAGDWRLRGMAVTAELQGQGLGRRLVEVGQSHIRKQDGSRLWCNARVSAQAFYEQLGFTAEGDRFEIPAIGPHYVMSIGIE